jgi:drug/metabolite transporter (DMT)-like permease
MSATRAFDTRAWLLFAALSLLWGIPYLLIKQAVVSLSPAAMVSGRTLLGALLLLPFALRQGGLRQAWSKIGWVLAFGAIEMAGPFFLLGHAEQTLASGLTGLLISTVPLFAALTARIGGDRAALSGWRVPGLILGFTGVGVIVAGPGLAMNGGGIIAVAEVLLVAVMYATAPFIVAHKLNDVPPLGSITLSLAAVGLFYLPIAVLTQHTAPTATSLMAVGILGVLCTALAFIVFFALIARVGPARTTLITYVNPVIAVLLGALILSEPITANLGIGFPMVLLGCWLAATGGRLRRS